MMDKIADTLVLAMLMARMKLNRLKNDESGMETLEVVILVAIAVVIAGIIISALKGDQGLVKQIFTKIGNAIDSLFGNNVNNA